MRGVPARFKISNAEPITTVAIPAVSKDLAARLTVWWQTGHNGIRIARSTASSRQCWVISGCILVAGMALAIFGRDKMEPRGKRSDVACGNPGVERLAAESRILGRWCGL